MSVVDARPWKRLDRRVVLVSLGIVGSAVSVFWRQGVELEGERIIDRVTEQGYRVEAAVALDTSRGHDPDDPCPAWYVHLTVDGDEQFGGPLPYVGFTRGGAITESGASLGAEGSLFISVVRVPEDVPLVEATYGDARDAMAPVDGWAVLTGTSPVSAIDDNDPRISFAIADRVADIQELTTPAECAAET